VARVLKSRRIIKKAVIKTKDEQLVQLAAVETLMQDYDISAKSKEVFNFILRKGGLVTKTLIENGLSLKRSNLNLYLSELEAIDLITVFSARNRKFQRIRSRKHSKVILVKKVPSEIFKREPKQKKINALKNLELYDRWFVPLNNKEGDDRSNGETTLFLQKWSPELSQNIDNIINSFLDLDFTREEAAILAYTFILRTASLSSIKQSTKAYFGNSTGTEFEIRFSEALKFLEKSHYITRYGKKSASGTILISSFSQIGKERMQQLERSEELLDLSINSLLNEYFSNFQRKMVQYIHKDVFNAVSEMLMHSKVLTINMHNLFCIDELTKTIIQLSVQNKLERINFCVKNPSMIDEILDSFAAAWSDKYEQSSITLESIKEIFKNNSPEKDKFSILNKISFYNITDYGMVNSIIFDEHEVILLQREAGNAVSGVYTVFYKTTEKEFQKFTNSKPLKVNWLTSGS